MQHRLHTGRVNHLRLRSIPHLVDGSCRASKTRHLLQTVLSTLRRSLDASQRSVSAASLLVRSVDTISQFPNERTGRTD
jgi:hypothetical protein